ncbi:MAG: Stealth CR1 domain-containing protein [Alistipes sp.]|jgi:hypothetical protein|nr:Stealth CR1 domain-containing protein [Alistipes sp.]
MNNDEFAIDLVYLWVDGNDPAWLARKRAFTGDFREGSETDSPARYESNDELLYSLRSAEMYAPWIRQVFIVTDGQTPPWLDTSNPRVTIVDHREILPPEALPCYNASVIEYFLYKISGLSERFLLSNDDTFFAAPLSPDFFFAPDTNPIVRLKRKVLGKLRQPIKKRFAIGYGQYRQMLFRSARLVERETGKYISSIPHHNIDAYRKSDYKHCAEVLFVNEVKASQRNHTRAEGDFHRSAFSFYALAAGHAHARYVGRRESLIIRVNRPDFMGFYEKYRPKLMCLNDNQRATADDRRRIKPFLEALFPEKSSFEK